MRKVAILLALLQALCIGITQSIIAATRDSSENCSKNIESTVEKKAGDYRVKISRNDDRTCQRLEILDKNQTIFEEDGIDYHYTLGNEWNGHRNHFLMNLTGHGVQLIIKKWTGGAHCCNSLLIFDVQGEFRKIDEIYGGNYDFEIVDLDNDGLPEIRLTDDFLAYRFSSFATSAQADVILKYKNDHYSVAADLMKRSVRLESFKADIPRWRKQLRDHSDPDWPPPPFIQAITRLIFSGNESLAFRLLDDTWPQDTPGKPEFLKSYREALADSKYYSGLNKH